ncbi:MAG: hypothetical protein QOE55_3510 [Acidobacteriaceae bacterium]|nr:hypothetical protein [Acidobacteriaceae bacterium]
MFEFPLLGGFVAGFQEGGAFGVGVLRADGLPRAVRDCPGEGVLFKPEAGAGEEAVFDASADQALEVEVGEVELEGSAGVLLRDVTARDAFVVGGEGDGDVGGAVVGERVILASYAEDAVVGGEVDLDHDVAVG